MDRVTSFGRKWAAANRQSVLHALTRFPFSPPHTHEIPTGDGFIPRGLDRWHCSLRMKVVIGKKFVGRLDGEKV